MRRRLFNLLSLAAVPLCAAVLVLWAQSWIRPWYVRKQWTAAPASSQPVYYQIMAGQRVPIYKPRLGAYAMYSQWGRVQVSWGEGVDLPAVLVGFFRHAEWRPDLAHPWRLLGVYVERERPGMLTRFHYFSFPYWLPAALSGPLAVRGVRLAIDRRRRRRRRAAGCCPRCGYDLRATPQQCPECGATAPPA
jgi:hypothetical protein